MRFVLMEKKILATMLKQYSRRFRRQKNTQSAMCSSMAGSYSLAQLASQLLKQFASE